MRLKEAVALLLSYADVLPYQYYAASDAHFCERENFTDRLIYDDLFFLLHEVLDQLHRRRSRSCLSLCRLELFVRAAESC